MKIMSFKELKPSLTTGPLFERMNATSRLFIALKMQNSRPLNLNEGLCVPTVVIKDHAAEANVNVYTRFSICCESASFFPNKTYFAEKKLPAAEKAHLRVSMSFTMLLLLRNNPANVNADTNNDKGVGLASSTHQKIFGLVKIE